MLNRYLLAAGWLTVGIVFSVCLSTVASAQDKVSDGVVKIGVLTDMSGVTSDISGSGSVIAARMAIEDFGGEVLGEGITNFVCWVIIPEGGRYVTTQATRVPIL